MATKSPKSHRMVWMDLEMTGLDVERHVVVEIATIVTDGELEVIEEGPDLVIHATDEELSRMVPVVQKMHASSGLTEAIRKSRLSVADAETETLEFLRRHCPRKGVHPLCGNTIGTDRRFLDRHMPRIENHLSYRSVDVSSIKELARRWYPAAYRGRPEKQKGHRALADIQESIAELRHWRDTVFRDRGA